MEHVKRLNYIGSKYKLIDWIQENIKSHTDSRDIYDVFAGTGIVSYVMRMNGFRVQANDAELYSSIITSALTCSTWTPRLENLIKRLNASGLLSGNITKHYSPEGGRMFFTTENAQRIDCMRQRISTWKLTIEERTFLLASLVVAADNVSNVPAVYGSYLKQFKAKALRPIVVEPIHMCTIEPHKDSCVYNSDSCTLKIKADISYIDPPYNERQYSKNYFPLNVIAMEPHETIQVHGKTGIPEGCFLSPFCKKSQVVDAFNSLLDSIDSQWVFISYNNESILSKDELVNLLEQRGQMTVHECDYKRFKSFSYNKGDTVTEYLFCLNVKKPSCDVQEI